MIQKLSEIEKNGFSLKKKGRIRIISGDFSKQYWEKKKFDHIIGSERLISCQALKTRTAKPCFCH